MRLRVPMPILQIYFYLGLGAYNQLNGLDSQIQNHPFMGPNASCLISKTPPYLNQDIPVLIRIHLLYI